MTEIERILNNGPSDRQRDEPMPTEQQILEAEADLGFRFPASYLEFLKCGGLRELRINSRVLPPSEIVQSLRYLPDQDHVPFADNGCGDLYCWPRRESPEPTVVFADHETGTYSPDALSFEQWLRENRF